MSSSSLGLRTNFFFFFTTKARLSKIFRAKQSQLIREDLFLDRNEAEILRLKKEKVFKAQIQFYSQGILIAKDYYSSRACIIFFFLIHFFLSILILTFISFSFLFSLCLLFSFSFFFPFLFFVFLSLWFFFLHAPHWEKSILSLINHPHIPLSFIYKICP